VDQTELGTPNAIGYDPRYPDTVTTDRVDFLPVVPSEKRPPHRHGGQVGPALRVRSVRAHLEADAAGNETADDSVSV
jgi:hypothetical protein